MKNRAERESNLELLRIVSMIFIIIYHIILHGNYMDRSLGACKLLLLLIESFTIVHVNSYVLLTGYFQSSSRLRATKVMALNNSAWFYRVVFMFLFMFLGLAKPNSIVIFQNVLPIDYDTYWFLNAYIALYLFSPILNRLINSCNKKQLKAIIFGLFLMISIIPTITIDTWLNTWSGHSLITFILLYLIGAYLRKFPIEKELLFKSWSSEKQSFLFCFLYFSFAFISFLLVVLGQDMHQLGRFTSYIGRVIENFHISYTSPIVIIEAIFYLLFFRTIRIKSKFINKISASCFGVYLIHDNYYVRTILYEKLGITSIPVSIKNVFLTILAAIVIFIICTLIESIRRFVFQKIYNTNIAKKNRIAYQKYFSKLGININW